MALSSKQVAYLKLLGKVPKDPKEPEAKLTDVPPTSKVEENPKAPQVSKPKAGLKAPMKNPEPTSTKASKAKATGKLNFKVKSIADIKKARQMLKGDN